MGARYRLALYGQGLFNTNNSSVNQQQLAAIHSSGFNTVMLFALHVTPEGDFYYGDNPIVQRGVFAPAYGYLPRLVSGLKSGGTVDTVLLTIGSADAADYAHLKTLLGCADGTETLTKNFDALTRALPLDGFDFDLEEFPLDSYTDTVVTLTLLLHRRFGSIITYGPYTDEDSWLAFLAGVYAKNNNRQIVSAFNLQCYSGGAGNDPNEWADRIAHYGSPLGISDPDAFIVAGYSAHDSPSRICQRFSSLSIGGGFIWNANGIFNSGWTPKDYADAIVNGLNRNC